MKACPKCNVQHSKPGVFCSRSCANSKQWSESSNLKRSNTLKESIKNNSTWRANLIASIPKRSITYKKNISAKNLKKFEEGLICDNANLKKWLIITRGHFCEICKIPPEWQGKPLSLQVDHIDATKIEGKSNNLPSNIRLACPNCHSQTPNFSGRNVLEKCKISDQELLDVWAKDTSKSLRDIAAILNVHHNTVYVRLKKLGKI